MARTCTICQHPDRSAIDLALLAGKSCRVIAGQWSVSKSAVIRHQSDHLPAKLAKAPAAVVEIKSKAEKRADRLAIAQAPAIPLVEAQAAAEEAEARSLYDRLGELNRQTQSILAGALQDGDRRTALQAIGRAKDLLEIEAKMLGELDDSARIAIGVQVQAPPPTSQQLDLSRLSPDEYADLKRLITKAQPGPTLQIAGGSHHAQ